jgi:hypothetical protein
MEMILVLVVLTTVCGFGFGFSVTITKARLKRSLLCGAWRAGPLPLASCRALHSPVVIIVHDHDAGEKVERGTKPKPKEGAKLAAIARYALHYYCAHHEGPTHEKPMISRALLWVWVNAMSAVCSEYILECALKMHI